MQVEQARWTASDGWGPREPGLLGGAAQLVLLFGSTAVMKEADRVAELRRAYPAAQILGCSTAGEIYGTQVTDDSLVITAISFESTALRLARVRMDEVTSSFEAGERLAQALDPDGLVHVFVLSDGLKVNGAELVSGLTLQLPSHVTVTGGLSGDGTRFQETLVLCDEASERNAVAALGMYGESLKVGCASLGGWDPFGPERMITRSEGNVLHELDGKNALDLYKTYLGEHARELPASALRFPLMLRGATGEQGLVRTILGIDEDGKSMRFAGEMPEGSYARLMRANFERLIDGAHGAARTALQTLGGGEADLAILISCVGRRLVLQQRVEEEIESVREVLGMRPALAGFYSYGEICPTAPTAGCELHNQTMTITTLGEVA
jgi:hypothetical protein